MVSSWLYNTATVGDAPASACAAVDAESPSVAPAAGRDRGDDNGDGGGGEGGSRNRNGSHIPTVELTMDDACAQVRPPSLPNRPAVAR